MRVPSLKRFVADRYGAVALPAAQGPVTRQDVNSFFVATDGKGLAQLTQARFFSRGTLPGDFNFEPQEEPSDLLVFAESKLAIPAPRWSRP